MSNDSRIVATVANNDRRVPLAEVEVLERDEVGLAHK